MALIIDATLGGDTSNSYVTLAETNTYFEARLYSDVWTNASDDDKNKALVTATRRLDYEKYYGTREFSTQALAFPRLGLETLDGIELDSIIPRQVKEAQYELAIYMLGIDMSTGEVDTNNIAEAQVGSIKVKYAIDKNDNVSTSTDELPAFVTSLLADLSQTVSSGGTIYVGR